MMTNGLDAHQHALALDIGGTKLAAAIVARDGIVLSMDRIPTPRDSSAEVLFHVAEQQARRVMEDAQVRIGCVAVGCGGPMRYPEGAVSPLNIPAWRGFPLRMRLSRAFDIPCIVDNDAKAFAMGEWWLGAGRGSRNLLGMVVSTGVGGGCIADGRLLHGEHGNAGHIGHVVVFPDGPPCACGARGCLEAVASGSGLSRRWEQEFGSDTVRGQASAADLAMLARAGDERALQLFRDAGVALGRAIAGAASLLDLERVVLGGSVALHAWDLLEPTMRVELAASARLAFTQQLQVVLAERGDASGLLGAAALFFGVPPGG